jgi:hypothetical protein
VASYEIRISGRVDDDLLARFPELDAEIEPAETILRGVVPDQAALHRVLEQIQALGLELIGIRRLGGTQRSNSSPPA